MPLHRELSLFASGTELLSSALCPSPSGLSFAESKNHKIQGPLLLQSAHTQSQRHGKAHPSLLLKARHMGQQRLRSRNQEILNQISHNSWLFQGCNCRDQLRFIFRRSSPVPFFSSNSDQTCSWNSETGSAARPCFLCIRCDSQQRCQGH